VPAEILKQRMFFGGLKNGLKSKQKKPEKTGFFCLKRMG